MKKLTLILAATFASMALTCAAFAADKVIPRDQLPDAIKAQSSKVAKHPGFPGCQKGRILTTWETVLAEFPETNKDKHPCADAKEVYACQAFNHASIRCLDSK
jgi:hypothetical protein